MTSNNDTSKTEEEVKKQLEKELKKSIKERLAKMIPESMFTWVKSNIDRELYISSVHYTIKDMKYYLYNEVEDIDEFKKMNDAKIIKDYFDNLKESNCTWYDEFNTDEKHCPDFIDIYHSMNEYGLREAIKKFGKGQKMPTTLTLYESMKVWAFKKRNATK